MKSIFANSDVRPTNESLKTALEDTCHFWQELVVFTNEVYSGANGNWNYSGAKFGWSFRVSDSKRVLLYLLPRDKFFKVALVFGQKAVDAIMKSDIAEPVKTEILNAKKYAEGKGIRIDVKDDSMLDDIKQLIRIKFSN